MLDVLILRSLVLAHLNPVGYIDLEVAGLYSDAELLHNWWLCQDGLALLLKTELSLKLHRCMLEIASSEPSSERLMVSVLLALHSR